MDLSKIPPVPIYHSLVLVNNFVANSVLFMNTFAENIDKKISHVSNKITDLETLLSIVEAKLGSIPGLDDDSPAPTTTAAPSAAPAAARTGMRADRAGTADSTLCAACLF